MDNIKRYKKLIIPLTSSWNHRTWRSYAPVWLRSFADGLQNLIDWLPAVWKDRHWDDYYITKMLQRKIELQRAYLVRHNRHLNIDIDNYWMTVVLNLLELEHEKFYEMEVQDYNKSTFNFIELPENPEYSTLDIKEEWEDYDSYFRKYPSTYRKVLKKYGPQEKRRLAYLVADYNQKKCRDLLFKILKQKSIEWWD
jgi:hypothetical protein